MDQHVAIIYASRYGHTKLLAEYVARGAKAVEGSRVELLTTVDAVKRLDQLDAADAIIFGTPTYMGNVSSEMKIFMEACVGRWVSRAWSGKIAGGFTNSSNFSGDKFNTLIGVVTFAMQLGMIWVGVDTLPAVNEPKSSERVEGPGPEALNRNSASCGVMSSSFNVKIPGAPPTGDLQTGEIYGGRVARVSRLLKLGKTL